MRLFVETMNAVVVEIDGDGRVRIEGEDWSMPTLQERRAILHSAQREMAELADTIEILQKDPLTKPSSSS
ncbi:MAG TPA: hypothetical protein VG871_17630 [Vicinamibacterales bacterium]|nr:hypothetical protein [Vicinamibacterales bacterium]